MEKPTGHPLWPEFLREWNAFACKFDLPKEPNPIAWWAYFAGANAAAKIRKVSEMSIEHWKCEACVQPCELAATTPAGPAVRCPLVPELTPVWKRVAAARADPERGPERQLKREEVIACPDK